MEHGNSRDRLFGNCVPARRSLLFRYDKSNSMLSQSSEIHFSITAVRRRRALSRLISAQPKLAKRSGVLIDQRTDCNSCSRPTFRLIK